MLIRLCSSQLRFSGEDSQLESLSIQSIADMWYLVGKFAFSSSEIAQDFQKLTEKLDPKLVLKNWDDGMVVKLKTSTALSSFRVVHSLAENSLFLRRIVSKENIKWASEQYQC